MPRPLEQASRSSFCESTRLFAFAIASGSFERFAGSCGDSWLTRNGWRGAKAMASASLGPTVHSDSTGPLHCPHRARIKTCRSSCSRSSAAPESDRCARVCLPIRAYRRGRTCPGAAIGMRSGRKLATVVRSRRDKLGLSPRGPTRGASGSRGDNFRAWLSTVCYPRRYPA